MDVVAMLVLVGVVGAIILTPLFRSAGVISRSASAAAQGHAGRKAADILADLEFDHATGKLADDDYTALRSRVEAAAAAPAAPVPVPADADDVIDSLEAEIRAARRARRFCAGCGTALPKTARFCPSCGTPAEGRA